MMLNAYVEADILKNLTLRITAGYDSYSLKDRQFYPTSTPRGYFYKGQVSSAVLNPEVGSTKTRSPGSPYSGNTVSMSSSA